MGLRQRIEKLENRMRSEQFKANEGVPKRALRRLSDEELDNLPVGEPDHPYTELEIKALAAWSLALEEEQRLAGLV